jgi:hypothetical protein
LLRFKTSNYGLGGCSPTCQTGFVPEILSILREYNLSEFLTNYAKNADFPEKPNWKRIAVNAQWRSFHWSNRGSCLGKKNPQEKLGVSFVL